MPIEVEAPDGSIIEFPDGMSDGQIAAVMRKQYPPQRPRGRRMAQDAADAQRRGYGPGSSVGKPIKLSKSLKIGSPQYKAELAKLPVGAYYLDPQGNVRQYKSQGGNKIVQSASQRSGGGLRETGGVAANLNRGLVVLPYAAAALGTAYDAVTGDIRPEQGGGVLNSLGNSFQNNLAAVRGAEDDFAQRRPGTAALARGTGTAATALIPGGAGFQVTTRGGSALNAAGNAMLQAGAIGYLDRGTLEERRNNSLRNMAVAAPLAGTLGALTFRGAPKAQNPLADSPQTTLADAGVTLTPGQRMGGIVKNAEDLAQRAPILGPAISGARERGVQSLNRSVALQALQPVGQRLPRSVKPGYDTVRYVDEALGKVYDDAYDAVPSVVADDQLANDLTRISQRSVDLPESLGTLYDNIIGDRLARLRRGDLSGRDVKAMISELGGLQGQYTQRGGAEGTLGDMLGETRRALTSLVGRTDPEAAAQIAKADEGWGIYKIMNRAASKADARGGVFLPGQLTTAVRESGKRQGVNVVGRGDARLQQLSSAAQQVMPDAFGNPGTANAMALGAGGIGLITEPTTTIAVGTGLTTAATPYFLMGRKILEELPTTATPDDLIRADRSLAALENADPMVQAIRREVAARLARATGSGTAAANQRQPPMRATSNQ